VIAQRAAGTKLRRLRFTTLGSVARKYFTFPPRALRERAAYSGGVSPGQYNFTLLPWHYADRGRHEQTIGSDYVIP